jgi:DNA-binding IclR family transcriptional regulator
MPAKEKSDYIINTVASAFDILEMFHHDDEGMSSKDLTERLKLPRNKVFRLLGTLESRGYVELDRMFERYRLGLKNLELRQNYLRQGGLLKRAQAVLEEIVRQCHETAYLAILEKRHIVYLAARESDQTVRVVSRLGTRLPVYCTASGKVHLADLNQQTLDSLYPDNTFEIFTPQTHASKDALSRELEDIRRQGYAIDNEEYDREVRCIAAPVRDYSGNVVGSLSVSGPVSRMTSEIIHNEYVTCLLQHSNKLSSELGYSS